jgi:hypothetical protein
VGEEPNRIKWVGARPTTEQAIFQCEPGPWDAVRGGVTRTQVFPGTGITNGEATVYTVPAGKTFYMCTAVVSASASSMAAANLYEKDGSGNFIAYFGVFILLADTCNTFYFSYPMPPKIVSGHVLNILNTTGTIWAVVTGWIE